MIGIVNILERNGKCVKARKFSSSNCGNDTAVQTATKKAADRNIRQKAGFDRLLNNTPDAPDNLTVISHI